MSHVAIKCGTCVFNNRCDFTTGQCSLTKETVTAIVVTVLVSVFVLIGVGVCVYRKFCYKKEEYLEEDSEEDEGSRRNTEEEEASRGLLNAAASDFS